METKGNAFVRKINEGKSISIRLYNTGREINDSISKTIESIFLKYKRNDLNDIILFCVKELIANAITTNVKSLFFYKNNLNINNIADYVAGMTQFNDMIEKNEAKKYYAALPEENLWVKFNIKHNWNGIKFEITNNSPIVGIEEKQIRMKLQKSMTYIDLIDFNEADEDIYDEKMGLALVAILLKKARLDVNLFRVGTINGITLARIEVPFNSKFRSSRKKSLKQGK